MRCFIAAVGRIHENRLLVKIAIACGYKITNTTIKSIMDARAGIMFTDNMEITLYQEYTYTTKRLEQHQQLKFVDSVLVVTGRKPFPRLAVIVNELES